MADSVGNSSLEAKLLIKGVTRRLEKSEKAIVKTALVSANAHQDSEQANWSQRDLMALLCRVFKFGESDWEVDLVGELD